MRLFHISDLHIGKQLYGYNLLEDQKYILGQILEEIRKQKPDVLLIAGDIYDKPVPGADAVSLFDWFLTEISYMEPVVFVMLISGNHDSPKRMDFASRILMRHNIYIAGCAPQKPEESICRVTLQDAYGPVHFYLLPFVKPGYLRELFSEEENESYVNESRKTGRNEYDIYFEKLLERESFNMKERNVLLSHQFFVPAGDSVERSDSETITVGLTDNIDTVHLKVFDYVALGHIHRGQRCGKPYYRYCGTPMPYSVSEGKDTKSITLVTLHEKGEKPVVETIPLKPVRGIRSLQGTKQQLISQAMAEKGELPFLDDFVSITVTDEDPGRYIREELSEHFSHILEIRFDNAFTRAMSKVQMGESFSKDFLKMFENFFEMQNGKPMDEKEKELLVEMLKKAEEEE